MRKWEKVSLLFGQVGECYIIDIFFIIITDSNQDNLFIAVVFQILSRMLTLRLDGKSSKKQSPKEKLRLRKHFDNVLKFRKGEHLFSRGRIDSMYRKTHEL
jgi:hypothetical protein